MDIRISNLENSLNSNFVIKIMSASKIECWNCSSQLVQYYDKRYNGKRARCPVCTVEFPLD